MRIDDSLGWELQEEVDETDDDDDDDDWDDDYDDDDDDDDEEEEAEEAEEGWRSRPETRAEPVVTRSVLRGAPRRSSPRA
jgi:hypothetical protein